MLVELQLLDDGLRDMRVLQQRLAKLTKDNAAGLAVFDQMLTERAERIDETSKFIVGKTDEIRLITENSKRSRGRMGSITSQRELTALNKELDTQRRMNATRQEELTRLRAEYAEAEKDQIAKQVERDGLATQMAKLEDDIRGQLESRTAAATESQAKRTELRTGMPRRELSQYDRISKGRKGTAVANVIDGTCASCNMKVPPHQAQKVYRLESLERCQSCQRIIISFAAFRPPEEI
jgi:hypothetical protein